MTLLDDRPELPQAAPPPLDQDLPQDLQQDAAGEDERTPLSGARLALVGALSGSAAGFVLGGLFEGVTARVVGVVAAALAASVVGAGLRSGRAVLHYLALPVVFVGGYLAAIVLPHTQGEHGTVPSLVRQAIRNGGLAHPPVPFDGGWRFLLVALVGLLTAAGVTLAGGYRKPRLAVLLPLPLVLAGGLEQPKGHELLPGAVALALLLVALTVSQGSELAAAGTGDLARGFEVRRLASSVLATGVALALLALVSQVGVLFPQPAHSRDAHPQKPQVVPLSHVKNRPLFTATGPGPWRVGVLSVYQDSTWLLPADDPTFVTATESGRPLRDAPEGPTTTLRLTAREIAGFTLPTPTEPVSVSAEHGRIGYDGPRGVFTTRDSAVPEGLTYTVTARQLPSGDELGASASFAVPASMQIYTQAPSVPATVTQLEAKVASGNRWDRLQLLRKTLLAQVTAASSGVPVPVTDADVLAYLGGGKASPFQIVAAEALLARWVGLPSRIGFGYYDAAKPSGGTFRPVDGANWLEVWFPKYGWVPVLGTPLRAQSDLSATKRSQPQIRPSANQTLQIYVPVLTTDPSLTYVMVRFYALRIVPVLVLAWLLWRLVPVPARAVRRRRRRAWAAAHGAAGRVAVAYAGFRDVARDLGLDDGRTTPLEFLEIVDDDVEHRELAWLTTRALWGDLARDLRDEDAEAAEAMSRSLCQRLAAAQSWPTRLGAASSRASLREPWDAGLPNAWPRPRLRRARPLAQVRALLRPRRRAVARALRGVLATGRAS